MYKRQGEWSDAVDYTYAKKVAEPKSVTIYAAERKNQIQVSGENQMCIRDRHMDEGAIELSKNKYEIDMCNGTIMDKLVSFAIPLMVSGILQLMFNAVDIDVYKRQPVCLSAAVCSWHG